MLQKFSQYVGRWWWVARFRSHLQKNSHQWAVLGVFAAIWVAVIVVVVLLQGLLGGNANKWGKLVPVAGRVLLDDRPLNGGIVKFHPDASKGNKTSFAPSGPIDADGNYELHTGNRKGAPPGWYLVVIAPIEERDDAKGRPKTSKPLFNAKFSRDDRTDLRIEVKANGDYTLKLTK